MWRKIVLASAFAGIAAAVPAVHMENPELFGRLVRHAYERATPKAEPTELNVTLDRAEIAPETEVLLGKRVRIPADARGHYEAEFKLNGRRIDALVDTGATFVAINQSTARRIGLKLARSDFRYKVNTANGEAMAATAEIASLQIGRIHVDNVQAVILEDKALDGTLIGLSFLNRLASFQMQNGTLLLEQ
ncbi:retropepsin-like aspartic protease family protein [Nitratireductor luteus]|uniref:retropepsin-like aspartic protease family protein n=1 Tax=Nitratireductor luteus TaxID=2976980 RepID=UPI00223FB1DC|nr:TIGR02281 family clan AA aspartic protease [Nitratireductor luteus]